MPVFTYRAADRGGKTVDGVMEAPDVRAVAERLHRDAYFPIRIASQTERSPWWRVGARRSLRQRDLLTFTQQLATLFEASLPLDRALAVLDELAPDPRVKAVTTDLLRSVRGGASFSDALARHHPRPFTRLYINMVRAGEKGGVLEVTLRRLAEFLEARAAFTEAVVSAMIYPAIITLASAGAIAFLLTFVVPRFAVIFADLGQAVPLPTQILLSVSGALRAWWWLGALAILTGVFAWRFWTSTPDGRLAWDRTLLRLPLVGGISLKLEVARFARTLGTLLKSGVPVLASLAVVGEMMTNHVVARAVGRLGEGVKRGTGLAAPMGESPVFPPLSVHMVRVGEETGRLEEMLLKVADMLETDLRAELKRIIGLLEPAVILGMGLVVAFIVVAMLLAIFSINEVPL
jgi:general secretion pathway protein F